MPSPPPEVLDWSATVLGTDVTVVRGLRNGYTPWLLRAGNREVVLRVRRAEFARETPTEIAAMTYVAKSAGADFPVADLLGYAGPRE